MTWAVLRVGVALVALALSAVPVAFADLRLERLRSLQRLEPSGRPSSSMERTEVVYISTTAARLDAGAETFIVRADENVLLWLDHEAKAYSQVSLPVIAEDLLTDQEKECVRSFPQALEDLQGSVAATGKERTIGKWKVEELRISGQGQGLRFEGESWITHVLPVDLGAYHLLVGARAALSPATRGWVGKLLAAGGYPVEARMTLEVRGHQRIDAHRVGGVKEVEADKERYLPPPGYSPTLPRPPLDFQCAARADGSR